MALSREQQNAIMRQDAERRQQRELEELLALQQTIVARHDRTFKPHSMLVASDARAIGAVTSKTVRANRSSWDRSMRRTTTVGIAPGAKVSDGPSMLVTYADGSSEVVPVTRARNAKSRPSHSNPTTGVQHHITCADLPAINVD